ncbi:MAG: hypothetical protein JJE17_07800 [Peptostreptococcaceae bacterium]|nr:hypothetical protein [Peptostreptococcaceae bacterium]
MQFQIEFSHHIYLNLSLLVIFLEGLIRKSKIPIKKRRKKEKISVGIEITIEMHDTLELFGEEYKLGA